MSGDLILRNWLAYSAQVVIVAAVGALAAWLLRPRLAAARLFYWQALLALCLVLPLVEPWGTLPPAPASIEITTGPARVATPGVPARPFPAEQVVLGVLAAGAVLRGLWLMVGLWRLRAYRRGSMPLEPVPDAVVDMMTRTGA